MTSIDSQSQEFPKIPKSEYKNKLTPKNIQVKGKWEEYGGKERIKANKIRKERLLSKE